MTSIVASRTVSENIFMRPPTDPIAASTPPWHRRLLSARAAVLLLRNSVVGCSVFLLSLALMWLLVTRLGVDTYVAAAISFLVANSLHYLLARLWIFRGTRRGFAPGYAYFFVNAGVGLAVTMALFALLTEITGMHFIAARVIASVFAGLSMFALNAMLNFRSL